MFALLPKTKRLRQRLQTVKPRLRQVLRSQAPRAQDGRLWSHGRTQRQALSLMVAWKVPSWQQVIKKIL